MAATNARIQKADIDSLPNLASALLGTQIVFATDEWFACADRMIRDDEAVWREGVFSKCGKWMDGWECRRRREEGHDWCIVKLGCRGVIRAIELDTAHFTGNYSPMASVQGADMQTKGGAGADVEARLLELRAATYDKEDDNGRMGLKATAEESALADQLLRALSDNEDAASAATVTEEAWKEVLPLTPLGAGYEATRRSIFYLDGDVTCTHLRINMGPDGGIARLRVYGEVLVDPERLPVVGDGSVDLLAVEVGGLALACSNKHYGHPRNLTAPGRGLVMGDGWETARQPKRPHKYRRGNDGLMVLPGSDWVILKLGLPSASIYRVVIDTNFFAGNYPESCKLEGCDATGKPVEDADFSAVARTAVSAIAAAATSEEAVRIECDTPAGVGAGWAPILPRVRLGASQIHTFSGSDIDSAAKDRTFTHLKLTIFPDGGIMRVRVFGRPVVGAAGSSRA